MKDLLSHEFRYLFPTWLGCILLPLPALVFWRSDDGRPLALGLFFIGCASLVAYAFRRDIPAPAADPFDHPERLWRERMVTLAAALLSAFVLFSFLCLTLTDPRDFVMVFLAFLILIPSLCIVPYLTLVTRKPFAAVVLTLFLVACMKLAGCVVVVLVYGWHADAHGYTDMPWRHPNLLVWLFWLNTGLLSLALHLLGAGRFQARYRVA